MKLTGRMTGHRFSCEIFCSESEQSIRPEKYIVNHKIYDFVFTADQFSYMYTDAVGNYGVSDVCDEDSGIVRYSLYLERGPEISIDGDLKNITLAALAVEKNQFL